MHSTPGRKPNGRLKIKVEQATCDQCRLNKVQCLAPDSVEERCRQCKASATNCTWVIGPRPFGRSPPSPSFVSYLENRVGELERKLKHILPGINLNRELETLAQLPALPPPQPTFTHLSPSTSTPQSSPSPAATPFQHIPAQNEPPVLNSAPALLKQVRQVTLSSPLAQAPRLKNDMYWSATASTKEEEPRFHGTSSGEILLRDAKEIRREYVPWAGSGKILRRRHEFWEAPLPERRCRDAELDPVELPPADLIRSLVNLFFRHMNTFYPIFHRGWFEHRLLSGAHLASDTTGRTFARLLLLVCAVASRWSSDPRVFIQGQTLSAGYEFFRRAGPVTWAVRAQPSIYDVQICILSAMFLHGTSTHYAGWVVLGIGIRLAQDVGAHRRKEGDTIENELYKRAFWTLLIFDRMICAALGRPSAMQDTDSDLEPLIEIDDEDWPIEGARSQDLEKPSRLSYFNGLIGITRILGRAIQTLYALDRTKRQMGLVGSQKEGELLVDLQRHLEQWKQTIPSHLRIETASGIFVEQAIALWSTYHHVNIIIHREFITKESVLTANCLNRCRRSAHECARLLDLQLRSEECHIIPVTVQAAFSSAMVLTFDLLSGEKASRNDRGDPWPSTEDWYPKVEKEANLKTCMLILELAETKYYIAGRWHDTLKEFLHSGVKLDSFRPEHKVQGSSPSIDQPPANRRDSGSMPGPGEPYPFNFTYDPPRGPSYGPEQVSGMVAGTATSSPSLSVAAYNTFVLPYTAPSNVPAAVYPHSAYLPDAYYGGDTAIPFPGYVSQLNFDPNQGREEEYEWERQASTSQWQQHIYNPWYTQGGNAPQGR
ncbi:Fungal specific transcription factor domain [Rhizoctonia solani]|uniref:Fungal specific transcription factor domain n=1 Tax=Rhizoctonia solani TaxID=456999 RepID=A0A8H7HCH7_9AGAM|nr:Fungal specific transcription factor domain [Rhizoctonia solani]KAF8684017.1 hypothetical protein RHS04_01592 [Rhizoctonia solani]QRW24023.1 Fungal specific transcription factor domain [Rhizoctonia solani]